MKHASNRRPLEYIAPVAIAIIVILGGMALSKAPDIHANITVNTEAMRLQKKVDELEAEIAILNQQLIEATSQTPVPTTSPPPAPDSEQCRALQASMETTWKNQGLPEGAYYDCTTARSLYRGAPGDAWTLALDTDGPLYPGTFYKAIDKDYPSLPHGKSHPKFPDALTFDQIERDMAVCLWTEAGVRLDKTVYAFVLVVTAAGGADGKSYAGWRTTSQVSTEALDLAASGIIPYQDGNWSVAHVTEGACPK